MSEQLVRRGVGGTLLRVDDGMVYGHHAAADERLGIPVSELESR